MLLLTLGVLQPPCHIPSRCMGLTPRTHPPNDLMGHGGLPATHLRLSGDPCLLCFLWMQCVVSVLVVLHKPLVLFQVLSLLRHLPQEYTLQ